MEIKIDINDYLPPERIVEIIEEELRYSIRSQLQKEADIERVLANFTSEYVFSLIESEWLANAVDFEKALREKIEDVLKGDISYYIFRRKDAWLRSESPAVAILDEECRNSRPLIREAVEKHIREYPFHELDREEIGSVIYDVIMEKILKPRENNDESND